MRKVKILTDSCSDLNKDLLDKYNIDYLKMNTVFEGITSPAKLDWTPDDVHKMYNLMRDGKYLTTTQVPIEEFQTVFTKYCDEGFDIVYIGCSSKQSRSVETATIIAKQLTAKNHQVSIYCIDSLNACLGQGMIAIEAAKFAENGNKSAKEVNDFVLSIRKKVHEYATVHTLDYLKRAGRVKGSTAFLGYIMNIKPILISDKNGEQVAYKKVKGRIASLKEIVHLLKESIVKPEEQTIYIGHADCSEEEVDTFVDMVKNEIPCKEIFIGYIGPIIGASIGPDAIVINGFGDEITYAIEK